MKSIDIKSLLIGILGTALVMVLMGLTHSPQGKYLPWCPTNSSRAADCFLTNLQSGVTKNIEWRVGTDWAKDTKTKVILLGNKPDF